MSFKRRYPSLFGVPLWWRAGRGVVYEIEILGRQDQEGREKEPFLFLVKTGPKKNEVVELEGEEIQTNVNRLVYTRGKK